MEDLKYRRGLHRMFTRTKLWYIRNLSISRGCGNNSLQILRLLYVKYNYTTIRENTYAYLYIWIHTHGTCTHMYTWPQGWILLTWMNTLNYVHIISEMSAQYRNQQALCLLALAHVAHCAPVGCRAGDGNFFQVHLPNHEVMSLLHRQPQKPFSCRKWLSIWEKEICGARICPHALVKVWNHRKTRVVECDQEWAPREKERQTWVLTQDWTRLACWVLLPFLCVSPRETGMKPPVKASHLLSLTAEPVRELRGFRCFTGWPGGPSGPASTSAAWLTSPTFKPCSSGR